MRRVVDTTLLSAARESLGNAVQNAVYEWGETVESFFDKAEAAGILDEYERSVNVGYRGCEIVSRMYERLDKMEQGDNWDIRTLKQSRQTKAFHPEEYWTGWSIALFQYLSEMTFEEIFERITPQSWLKTYYPYHELGEFSLYNHMRHLMGLEDDNDKPEEWL
jgi:hypothetical protein